MAAMLRVLVVDCSAEAHRLPHLVLRSLQATGYLVVLSRHRNKAQACLEAGRAQEGLDLDLLHLHLHSAVAGSASIMRLLQRRHLVPDSERLATRRLARLAPPICLALPSVLGRSPLPMVSGNPSPLLHLLLVACSIAVPSSSISMAQSSGSLNRSGSHQTLLSAPATHSLLLRLLHQHQPAEQPTCLVG